MIAAKDPYYGINDGFTRYLQHKFYRDSSMDKQSKRANSPSPGEKRQFEIFNKVQELARYRRKLSRQTHLGNELLRRQREVHASAILLDAKFEWAAVTIQRHFRGYIQRFKYNQLVINQDITIVSKRLLKLKSLMYKVFYSLGPVVKNAAIRIQSKYRQYLAFKQFKARKVAYLLKRHNLNIKSSIIIQKYIRGFQARAIYKCMKEFKVRDDKLNNIREKLQILSLKKLWIKTKFNWKTICKKYGLIKCRRLDRYHLNSREATYCCFKDLYTSFSKSGRKVSVDIQNRCYYKPQVKVIYPLDKHVREIVRASTSHSYRSRATAFTAYSSNPTPTPPPNNVSKHTRYTRKGVCIVSEQKSRKSPQPRVYSSFDKYEDFPLFTSYESVEKNCRSHNRNRSFKSNRSFCL